MAVEWGTPEHDVWLAELGRRAFCAGEPLNINAIDPIDPVHLKLNALDLDKLDDKENNYEIFPTQSGE